MDRMMHLDYTTFQGRRIPYFKTKQDAEQALLGGLIKDGQEVAISRDSFRNVEPGHAYVFAKGLGPLVAEEVALRARVGREFAEKEAANLAARQAAERQAAEQASREQAARASAQRIVARTAAERTSLLAEQEAAAQRASARAAAERAATDRAQATAATAAKSGRSAAGFVAKGATITAVVGATAVGGTALVAQFKKEPQSQVTDLPNGDKLVTYPDGSTAIVGPDGKVKSTSGPSGVKGAAQGASDLFKWAAVGTVVILGGVALNRSSKAKHAATAATPTSGSKKPMVPANAKSMAS